VGLGHERHVEVERAFHHVNTTERGETVLEARVRGTNLRSSVRVELVDP
jgi:hypothetical protein